MSDAESTVTELQALKELGMRVVADDSGMAAYSSLSRLGRFPTDYLDIDCSLALRLGPKPEDTTVVAAVVSLAHSLGWVVAEGVETADQRAWPRELGCDMAQGGVPLGAVEQRRVFVVLGGRLVREPYVAYHEPNARRRVAVSRTVLTSVYFTSWKGGFFDIE